MMKTVIILDPIRYRMTIGVDEAGRGPVIGPLVVSSLFHPDDGELGSLGIKDSKLLTRGSREALLPMIRKKASYFLLFIPASAIDEARRTMTMNRLEVLSFSSVIASLISLKPVLHPDLPRDIRTDHHFIQSFAPFGPAILDAADVDEDRFGREVAKELSLILKEEELSIISRHKADRDNLTVGAASIVAKIARDEELERISKELGCDVGSGYPSDRRTMIFLEDWISEKGDLPPYCRRSWDTSRRLLAWRDQSTLLSFDRSDQSDSSISRR